MKIIKRIVAATVAAKAAFQQPDLMVGAHWKVMSTCGVMRKFFTTKKLTMEKMSDEAEAALQKFKDAWIGKRVKIVGIDHPHRGESGECSDVEYTDAGWGIRINLENGEGCFCFKGTDIRHDPLFE